MEFVVVRINWKQLLAFVPMQIDGNIYWGKEFHFGDVGLQLCRNNGSKNASPKQVPIRPPILRRNIANCAMKRYALESQRPQLSNA